MEAGEHGTLASGQVLAGITFFPYLIENLLQEGELIGHKWIVCHKDFLVLEALQVCRGVLEHEEIIQRGLGLFVCLSQSGLAFFVLGKDSPLDYFINRG